MDRPLFGKTGTTNGPTNAWFMGGSPDLVAGVYIGYDQPRNLGGYVQGGNTAAPIWRQAMSRFWTRCPNGPSWRLQACAWSASIAGAAAAFMAHGRRTSLRLPSFGKRSNLKQNRAAPSAGKKSSYVKGMRRPTQAACRERVCQYV